MRATVRARAAAGPALERVRKGAQFRVAEQERDLGQFGVALFEVLHDAGSACGDQHRHLLRA
jgi:hypothetical protein